MRAGAMSAAAVFCAAAVCAGQPTDGQPTTVYDRREADWRSGAVVYQVFVDRFAPPEADRLDAKRGLYAPPRRLEPWLGPVKRGRPVEDAPLWSHELEFRGGDLDSLRGKLGHVERLGATVVYLNPIFDALSNHKYDTRDYSIISPEYGNAGDLSELADDLHARGMKLVLDGVFNHVGRAHPWIQTALADEESGYRGWFFFDEQEKQGFRTWANSRSLPELRLENRAVRGALWMDRGSVVRSWLRAGADGWRLDTAYELGPEYCRGITDAAHGEKPGSLVVGEMWAYPAGWTDSMDGVMNFHVREMLLALVRGQIDGRAFATDLSHVLEDCGPEPLLRSWLILDNHDTARLTNIFPDVEDRALAQTLQFTLPGSPVVYYGVEFGMEGDGDPACRGTIDWESADTDHPEFVRLRKLIEARRSSRALRVGDTIVFDSQRLLVFERRTDRLEDTRTIVCNPTDRTVTETVSMRDPRSMTPGYQLHDMLSDVAVSSSAGVARLTVPPKTVWVLAPRPEPETGFSPSRRVETWPAP